MRGVNGSLWAAWRLPGGSLEAPWGLPGGSLGAPLGLEGPWATMGPFGVICGQNVPKHVFSVKRRASDHFAEHGSEATTTISAACAQTFAGAGLEVRRARTHPLEMKNRQNPYSRSCLGNIYIYSSQNTFQ